MNPCPALRPYTDRERGLLRQALTEAVHLPQRDARPGILREAERAVVLFESPHRLQRSLDDLVVACGPERPVAVCRELTKLHEEVWRCSLGEAAKRSQAVKPRGEYVVVLGPPAGHLPGGPPSEELEAVGTEPL